MKIRSGSLLGDVLGLAVLVAMFLAVYLAAPSKHDAPAHADAVERWDGQPRS